MKYDIAFIIVTWNAKGVLLDCLESLYREISGINYEVFVVDNASVDGTVEAVKQKFQQVKIIENSENLGFAKGNNIALKEMSARYSVLLNSDTIVHKGVFERLLQFMDGHLDVAVAGPQLINRDGSKQNCFHNFPTVITEIFGISMLKSLFPRKFPGKKINYTEPLNVDAILGACFMIRKEATDQVGFLDENYFFFLEETDLCFNFKKRGWKVYHLPDVKITHLHGESTKKKEPVKTWIEFYRSNYRFFKKNRGICALISVVIARLVKLNINFVLMALLSLLLMFRKKKYNQKLITYGTLLFWHYRLCPKNMGLKSTKKD